MTREQAKQNLIGFGIEEPTDEQVSNYLNQIGGETKKEKERADKYKSDAEKVAELQKQIDEMNDANLSEIDKANKKTEEANGTIADLQKQIQTMKIENQLAKLGISEKLFADDGSIDFDVLGEVISNREKQAVADYEKKALEGTPNPEGGKPKDGDNKTEAEKIAEGIAKSMATPKESADIINAYI